MMPKAKKARKSVAGAGSGELDHPRATSDNGISTDDVSKLPSHPSSNMHYSSSTTAMLVQRESVNWSPFAASSLSSLGDALVVTSHPLSPSASNSKPGVPDNTKSKNKKTKEDRIFDGELHEKIHTRKAEKKHGKKAKKRKEKKKLLALAVEKELSTQRENRFETEAEILSRLPPLTPALLAEVKDIEFYIDLDREDGRSSNQNETAVRLTEEKVKYHWGDTDSEDDQEQAAAKSSETRQGKTENSREDPETRISSFGNIGDPEVAVALTGVEESQVDRLHGENISNLNGNEDKDGNFRKLHETLTVDSFKEDVLHIYPYTVFDF